MGYKDWSVYDRELLYSMLRRGDTVKSAAKVLHRTPQSVYSYLNVNKTSRAILMAQGQKAEDAYAKEITESRLKATSDELAKYLTTE